MNNKKIKYYNTFENVLFTVILKDNKYINYLSKGLLFLSKKKVIFKKDYLNILKSNLLKSEDENLLEAFFVQCELQPDYMKDNIDFIYKIQLNYQKNNVSKQNIDKIFDFFLSLPEKKIAFKDANINLENHLNEMNIYPLCYKLLKKIPNEKRGIILSQKLSNFNDKEFGIIHMNNEQFKLN